MARRLANWLDTYLEYTAITEAPESFHLWTGISAIAGALRSCVWVAEGMFRWTPNFYTILVGPPGIVGKSTTIDIGMSLLEAVPDISFGPSSATWQGLVANTFPASIITIKWVDENGVPQESPASCVTLTLSELGTFLKVGTEGFIDVLIDLWDGKISQRAWTHVTKGSGTNAVTNPWLNILGATTPAWIQANVPDHMVGGGFMSRVVFVYGDKKRMLIPYPSRLRNSNTSDQLRRELIADLTEISQMRGPFTLTQDAFDWGTKWYGFTWGVVPTHMVSKKYEGYRARKQTHLHKVAMVLSASRSSNRIIDEATLIEADKLLLDIEHSMTKVFESIGVVEEATHVHELATLLRNSKSTHPKGMLVVELYKMVANTMTVQDYNDALKAGMTAGRFRPFNGTGGQWVELT